MAGRIKGGKRMRKLTPEELEEMYNRSKAKREAGEKEAERIETLMGFWILIMIVIFLVILP